MTDLNIQIDMGRIQSSVQAAVRPAVEEALNSFDIKAAITRALASGLPSNSDSYMYLMGMRREPKTLLDSLVEESIRSIAKEYVTFNIREQKGEIEEAFRKMMTGSANKLVRAFAAATQKALEDEWEFDFSVKVEHAQPDRDDDE